MEPVTGTVRIKHDKPLTAYRLSSSGKRLGEAPVQKTREGTAVEMRPENRCMHYELVSR
jgi:hypothetical protein